MQSGGKDAESRARSPESKVLACCPLTGRPGTERFPICFWAPVIYLWCGGSNAIKFIEHSEHQVRSHLKVFEQYPSYYVLVNSCVWHVVCV